MEFAYSKPLFIDSSALSFLYEPRLLNFWKGFEKGVRHCVSHVVCWEYLRGCSPRVNRRPNRDQFVYWRDNQAEVLAFGQKEVEHATAIYQGLEVKWRHLPKPDKRQKLIKVHADVMIAASAVERGLQVLTDDLEDWTDIWDVIKQSTIGPMGGFAVVDKEDIPGWVV
jgi:predicted nucleic acid-binding protein